VILPELDFETRGVLAWSIHQADTIKEGYVLFQKRMPEAHRYTYESVLNYSKSAAYLEDLKSYRERVADNMDAKAFVHRPERLDVLVNLLRISLKALQAAQSPSVKGDKKMTHRDRNSTIDTCRSLLKQIGEEFIPYETSGDGVEAPFAAFMQQMGSLSPQIQALIVPHKKPGYEIPVKAPDEEEFEN
jgi:hypothetical protein